MAQWEVHHHKFFMVVLVLGMLIFGTWLGARIADSAGVELLQSFMFGMLLINSVVVYVIFTQLLHVHESMSKGKVRK